MSAPARPRPLWVLMTVYLLGIFMGAIDTGIVTPARTIIQNDLGVDESTGIWLITIYTLAYAAAIPVMGKLADRIGRKPIYLISITLFGVGSLLCGLSQDVGSFELLIAARAIQAIGGGGILPVATAEFGTAVPPERRGMALGLVGGVYGVANVFGSSAGSLILDIAGPHNWQYIFYINLPISAAIIAAGLFFLPNHRNEAVGKIDLLGTTLLVAMIVSLLYGLKNLDYFDLAASLSSTEVYPFLLAFVVLLPLFVLAERRAADPVLNLRYFSDFAIATTLALSFLSGVVLMGVVFVPQFAENALGIASGKGGYFVIILGLASGIGAPLSGRLTDRFGPKVVLGTGFVATAIAAAVGIWWAIPDPSWPSVITTLALLGLGLGFTIGSPLNYMMLERTRPEESNSALATLSLVRAIGTTLAPAILVGFLAQAGTGLQASLTAELPNRVTAPALPYAAELQRRITELKADPELGDQLKDVDFPDLDAMTTVDISIGGGGDLPDDLVELLKSADVTTITERTKVVAERMFAEQTPPVIADITDGVDTGLASLSDAREDLAASERKVAKAAKGLKKGIAGMREADEGMASGIGGMTKAIAGMDKGLAGTRKAIAGMTTGIDKMKSGLGGLDKAIAGQQQGVTQLTAARDQILAQLPPGVPVPAEVEAMTAQLTELQGKLDQTKAQRAELARQRSALIRKRAKVRAERADLAAQRATTVGKLTALRADRAELKVKLADAVEAREELLQAQAEMRQALAELDDTREKLVVLRDAVPGAFAAAQVSYLAEIDSRSPTLEKTFADTLNIGFRNIYLSTLATGLLGAALLVLYPRRKADVVADGQRPTG